MQSSRAQISVFIILGILILIIIGLAMLFLQQTQEAQQAQVFTAEETAVTAYITSCVEQTGQEALFTLGLQGGYETVPEPRTDELLLLEVPYFLYETKTYVPTLEEIAMQVEAYMMAPITSCLAGLENIPSFQGTYELEELKVAFQEQEMSIDLRMPVTIFSEGSETTRESFHAEIATSFPVLYELAQQIVDKTIERGGYFPMTYSSMSAAEKGYELEYISVDDGMIISLIDPRSFYDEQQLFFTFALSNQKAQETEVEIEEIGPQKARVYYPFSLIVHAKGEDITFTDTTEFFDIDEKTGNITFTPLPGDEGNYSILIQAENTEASNVQVFTLEILSYNQAPVIEKIPTLYGTVGIPLYYDVNATDPENDSILFISSEPLLEIEIKTGIINNTFSTAYNGTVTITVIDAYGNSQSQEIYVRVRE